MVLLFEALSVKSRKSRSILSYKELLPGKTLDRDVSIIYSGKYEGAFLISLFVKDSIAKQTTFGYYSNAEDIKSKYVLEVLDHFKIVEKQGGN